MQLSPSIQWPSHNASVCSNTHQGRCMGRCAGPCTEFGWLWCLLWEFPLQMDGQASGLFLVSHQDFPKLRDTYQNKFSNHYQTNVIITCFSPFPWKAVETLRKHSPYSLCSHTIYHSPKPPHVFLLWAWDFSLVIVDEGAAQVNYHT